ncbi:HlyD family efflux transporter periplasmic adaptor subunit [Propionicicella superfundia]|uniref:HlyD family efflux transporter periplasmic adaptor subunit n=1 Tax=Propionicicella superfundia TaxID=348582 RepID=UPI00041B7B2A|nr:HlyD family secretion protein [Propionicicella superfundia]
MTWSHRLKLSGGILVTIVVMAALTLLFNHREATVTSVTATVDAPVTTVGSGYGGMVTASFVTEGQDVVVGTRLFTVSSPSLLEALALGFRPPSTVAYDLDTRQGTVTYKAVTDGTVTDVTARPGTFVADGASLASIVANGERTVEAVYSLTPFDYGRIERGASVQILLPDNSTVQGRVSGVSVTTDAGEAVTKVVVDSDELISPARATLTRRGTPVVAILQLRDDGILAGPTDAFLHFLTKIGLR